MRRGSRLGVADRAADPRTEYDVVLLAGSPRRLSLRLDADTAEGSLIEADGQVWTVADVRHVEGARTQLICIYAPSQDA